MKKIIAWLLVVTLTATAAVGGTLAYFTDRDSEANVFTVGNVEIDLEEDFEQGAELIPGVNIEKKPTITNVGPNDAWVWLEFAIPSALDNYAQGTEQGSNENVIHWNPKGATTEGYVTQERVDAAIAADFFGDMDTANLTADYINENKMHWNVFNSLGEGKNAYQTQIEVDGKEVDYNVYVLLYNKALPPGETTLPNIEKVFLDARVDIDPDGNWNFVDGGVATPIDWNSETNGSPVIYVSAYAMQKENFETCQAAYAAYQTQWGDNGSEYADPDAVQMPGDPAPENYQAEYNGTVYDTIYDAVAAANANGGGTVTLLGSAKLDKPVEITSNITIKGEKPLTTYARADGYTGTMFTVAAGATLTTENLVLDGAGATATGNLIATAGNGSIVLNAGTVLQNNNGAHAVSLATRGGGTLTLNGAQIINNSSDSGAIWGGGHIIVNEGSKINNNSSTGSAGAIRMVSSCNLTMNGGEISSNKAAGDGGAIWGYGASTYNFNGGKMSNNESAGTGGAIYTGTYSVINISGDFEMCGNKAANSGAIRLTDHTSLNMTGGKISGNTQNGESNAFNTWNNSISLTGGSISDNISFVGGLGLTIGAADIDGVISYNLSTNHNTAYLAENFGSFKFIVNEEDEHFGNFNFKPAAGYTYTAGDEDKLICMNEGYSTYWDAATGTFKIKAN